MSLDFFLWGYVKDIVYKTSMISLFLWGHVKDIVYKTSMISLFLWGHVKDIVYKTSVIFLFLWGYVKDTVYKTSVIFLFLWGYVKDTVYKTPVTSFDELKLRIVAAIETVTPQLLKNTWREIEYCLDILRINKGVEVEVVSILQYGVY
jgi:hypothetical protein